MRGWHRTRIVPPAYVLAAVAFVLGAAGSALWSAEPPAKTATQPKPAIKKIDVQGYQRISQAGVIGAARLKEGDPYDPKTVEEAVNHLWTLGAFEDIKVHSEPFEGGIRLLFIVKERAVVGKIVFVGNKSVKDDKLKEVLEFRAKDYLNRYLVQSGRDKLVEKYHDEGFPFVEVSVQTEEAERRITVTYSIQEGPRVKVRAINFVGVTAYSAYKLRQMMQTSIYRWVLNPGVYKEETLHNDLIVIRDFYRSNGWLDVVVGRELTYSSDKSSLYITIRVQEGERYKLLGVSIAGNDLFTEAEIRLKLTLKEGSFFVTDEMRKDQEAIRDMYGEQGFIDVQVRPRTLLAKEGAALTIRYEIEEGRRSYVESVKIRGLEKTQDHVVRREITLSPGERFDTRKIKESQARLRNTGLFQSYDPKGGVIPIRFDTEPGTEPDRRDLVADLTEGKTGELNLGVGVSSNVGLVGEFSISQQNFDITDLPKSWQDFVSGNSFVGGGQIITLRARPGTERQDYLLSFRDPSVFDTEYGFGASAFYAQRVREDWDESRLGGTLSLDRGFWKYWRAGVTLIPERVDVNNISSNAADVPDIQAARGSHSNTSVRFDITRDTRDNRFLATSGSRMESSLQIFSTALGGDYDIVKLQIEAKNYFPLFNVPKWGKHVLSVGVDAGILEPFGDTVGTPIFNRFFAGGPGDAAALRGFRFRRVGPVQGAGNIHVGGEVIFLQTVEYEFPIVSDTIRGVVFADAGKVAPTLDEFSEEEFRAAVGAGLRLRFPFFGGVPIALDWAAPVRKTETDETQVFSFTIGTGFRF